MGTPAKEVAKEGTAAAVPQMKLLVDNRSRRVLYAEARKDAVDFLIGLLRVPAGLAARVIAHAAAENADDALAVPGSLGTLYAGARALDDAFFVSATTDRDAILCPALPSDALTLLLRGDASSLVAPAPSPPPPPPPPPPPRRFFRCAGPYGTSCRGNPTSVTDVAGSAVPGVPAADDGGDAVEPWRRARQAGAAAAQEAAAGSGGEGVAADGAGGYVKEVVSYLVMDDLTVEPMSTISAIMLLKNSR
ncbi:hypothetical protein ACQ4PT_045940 [Festuca glaucescens]